MNALGGMSFRGFTVRGWAMALAVGVVVATPARVAGIEYPRSARVPVVEDYHGVPVEDPYRWMEADARESDSVATWIQDQNRVTSDFLAGIPEREAIRERLTALWDYERYSVPFRAGVRTYYFKNDGLQNQSVLYALDSLDGEPRVFLDPNTLSADGTVALGGWSFDRDGRYMAYGTATSGSDWQEWRVRDAGTGEDLPDLLRNVKFSSASWTPDGRGFFYSRYDPPAEGSLMTGRNVHQQIYYHRVGTPQTEDVLFHSRPDQPDWLAGASVTDDNRFIFVSVRRGSERKNALYWKDVADPFGQPRPLIETFEAEFSVLANDGALIYLKTTLDAPRGRIIRIDLRRPEREHWTTIIPESPETLQDVRVVHNLFILNYLKDAASVVRIHRMDGRFLRSVDLPGIGSAAGFGGKRTETETFYSFASFATPPSIYRYDMITGQSTLFRQARVDIDPSDYVVKQVFYTSRDGTRVPMFISHRKNLPLNGQNPTILYGYGGFNVSMTPAFSVKVVAWMEMGGVYAVACLRGGGEYGVEWHQAGTKLRKQNVFDDFIAAGEYLISSKYTSTPKLAISGASNGGLLVGACMTQRPDLFGAALPAVGVMDMLRFHKFTIGRAWTADYGSADNAEEFQALRAYSPLHNLKPGLEYPATLITTADHDDRVVPAHSFKFAAELQHAQGGRAPVLIRVDTKAGHGAGKPTTKQIDEAADVYGFLVKVLGMKPRL